METNQYEPKDEESMVQTLKSSVQDKNDWRNRNEPDLM